MDVLGAAMGIVDIANATMVQAMRLVTVQRGHDPRDFGLVAFGGAGPLHANALAAELGHPRGDRSRRARASRRRSACWSAISAGISA